MGGVLALQKRRGETAVYKQLRKRLEDEYGTHETELLVGEDVGQHHARDGIEKL